ncbi:WYL domain-containing protein [Algoriphagus sp.]|uniref:WYL domain-containing protein n=1 Tax=Algoriphagus sp. TaxID=1872435 RepID=UPI003F6F286A
MRLCCEFIPFLLYCFAQLSTDNWLLIAYCRLRGEFRYFRLDRIKKIQLLIEKFEPHKMTLQEFFDKYH